MILLRFGWALLGRIVAAVLQLVSLGILARLVEVEVFGITMALLGFATLIQSLTDLGLSRYIIILRAGDKCSPVISTALYVSDITGYLFFIFMLIAVFFAAWAFDDRYYAFIPLCVWVIAEKKIEVRNSILQADGENKIISIMLIARRLTMLIIFLLLAAFIDHGVWAFTIASAVTSLLFLIEAQWRVAPLLPLRSGMHWFNCLSAARNYWVDSVAGQIKCIDVSLVASVSSSVQAAYFGAVSRFGSPFMMVANSISMIIMPMVTRGDLKVSGALKLSFFVVLANAVPLLVIAYFSSALVVLALGAEYKGAAIPLQIFCVAIIFNSAGALFSALLVATGESKAVARTSIVASVLYIIALAVLSCEYGAIGASIALVCYFLTRLLLLSLSLANKRFVSL